MKDFYKKWQFWVVIAVIILIYGYNKGWFSKKMATGGNVLGRLNSTLGQVSDVVGQVGQIKNQVQQTIPSHNVPPNSRWQCDKRADGVNCTECSDGKTTATGGACGYL